MMSGVSVTENRVLMAQARGSLRGNWGLAIGSWVVLAVITVAIQLIPVAGNVLSLLISGPMTLGWAILVLTLSRNSNAKLEQIFEGFQRFGTSLGAYLLIIVFVALWSLLLIVPGIVAALAYSQTFYIIAEDKSVGPLEAIRKSKKLMCGNKWKFFCLGLRFTGWVLLCALTIGIGFLWLVPYAFVSTAKFYDDIAHGKPEVERTMTA
jgi:uncharacterized membrane protein